MNLDELAKKYGGSPVQSGSSKFDELARKYGGAEAQPVVATQKEESGFLRQVADVPLSIGRGAATGVRMIADAFGAGSGASEAIKGVEGYLSGLMSAQAKNDEQEIARIMKDAEDKGVLDQVKAGFKAFSVAPVDLLSQGLGTAAPAILGMLGGKVLGAGALGMSAISTGIGAGMGAGSAKGGIYEEVKAALKESGVGETKAEQAAIQAQEYGGKNLDQILLSAGLGGVAGRFGVEGAAQRILTRAAAKEAGKGAAREVAEGATRTAVTESIPELLQGSQEQVAKNIALQREGFDVPTMRGVAGSGTLEALAGAGLGAVTGGAEAGLRRQARGQADRIIAEEEKARTAADAPPAVEPLVAEPAVAEPSPTQAIEDQAADLERQQQRQQAAMERARAGGIGGGSEVNQALLEQARIRKEQQERAIAAEEKAAEAERQKALRAERVRIGSTQYSGDPMMNEVLRSRAVAEFDAANAPKVEVPKAPEYQPTKTIQETTPITQPEGFNVLRGVDARNADLMSAVSERRAAEEAAAETQTKQAEAKKADEAAKADTSRADVDQRVAQVENFLMSPVRKTQQETADYMAGVIPEMQKDFLALLDEDMSQPLTPEQTEALKTQIRQRMQPEVAPEQKVERTPFKKFLVAQGMNKQDVQDIFGENAYRANQQLPGSVRADAPRLDMLAEAAVEAGFLQEEDTEALTRMIKDELGGNEQVAIDMADDRAAAEYEAQRLAELEDRAAAIGLKTKGMKPEQIAARLDRIERKREEKRKQYSRTIDGFADLPTVDQDRIIDMMIDQFGEPQVFDVERAEIEGRVREEEELLQTQTEQQLRNKQAEIDRLEKENERLSKEAERKAKADEQVGDFVLTGSDRVADKAAARGQMDLTESEEPTRDEILKGVKALAEKLLNKGTVKYEDTELDGKVYQVKTRTFEGKLFGSELRTVRDALGNATEATLANEEDQVMTLSLTGRNVGEGANVRVMDSRYVEQEALADYDTAELRLAQGEEFGSSLDVLLFQEKDSYGYAALKKKSLTDKYARMADAVYDAVDAANKAFATKDISGFRKYEELFPKTTKRLKDYIGKATEEPEGITVVSDTKGKDDYGNAVSNIELSNGNKYQIIRLNSTESMGLPGWHDANKFGPTDGGFLGNTKAEAISALIERETRRPSDDIRKQATTGSGYNISAEDQRIEKELTGKSMIQAADWAVANAPNAFAKVIAEKVRNRLREFQRKGMTLDFNISSGSTRPRMLSGARGVTQFEWGKDDKGTKITVTLNGAAVMDNQGGYPPGVQYNTILHELLHVATRSQFVFMPNTDPLKKQMTELFNLVADRFNADAKAGILPPVMQRYYKRMNNVLTDPDELLAWGLTDKEVQTYLDDIKVGEKSIFTRLIELIRTALGLGKPYESALERLVRNSESMLDVDVDAIDAMLGQRDKQIGVKKKPAGPMTQESLFQKEGAPAKAPATGSAAFKKWFGDSKVVDENGKPLVVYHGTKFSNIGAFQGYRGVAGHFAFDPEVANDFAKAANDSEQELLAAGEEDVGDGGQVYPVYLKAENIFDARNPEHIARVGAGPMRDYDDLEGNYEAIKAAGFDSYYDFETGLDRLTGIAVFEPNQIKSATGNKGTYDPENADIRYQRDSITGKPILAQWTTPTDTKIAGDIGKDDIIYSLQNKMIDTKRVVDAITATAGKIAAKWNPYLQEELYHGRTAKQTKDFLTEELRPLMQAMEKSGVNIADMEEYLKNRHAIAYNAQVAKVNPSMPDKGSGISTADAQAYLNGLSAADKAKYEALAKRVDQITKGTRKLLVASGLETQETIDNWENTFPFYVPLKRGDIDYAYTAGGMGTGQGFDVRGDFSRRAMGSERDATDVLANIAMMRERAIVKSQKNRVAQALFGLAAQNPNPQFWLAVDPMAEVDPANMQELLNFGLSQQDLDFIAKEPRQKAIDKKRNEVVERINATLRGNENVLSMRFNGQDRYVFFNPNDPRSQRMAKSMKNLDADQLGGILGPISTVTRWMAAVNTQYNPIFGAYNFLRDVQGAALQLSDTPLAKERKAVVGGTLPALKGIYAAMRAERSGSQATGPWAALWQEFQQEGGQTGFRDQFSRSQERAEALQKELNKITEGKAKAAGRAIFDWLSDYNDSMENAVRLSAYKAALDKGINKQEAASIAKNLTVNFNRKGQIGVQAGALYAFFNAAVQGTTRLAQTLKGPAGKKIIAGGLLLGTMQAALLAAYGYDEEEPPEFVRERNLIIPLEIFGVDDKYIAFPMPLGYHVIPGTSRILTEWVLSGFKNTPERIASLTGMFLDAFNPIGNAGWSAQTLAPTFADPIVALTENKDWTGKPIARKDFSNLDPTPGYTRSKEATSVVFKEIAKFLNFASGGTDFKPGVLSPTPDQLDYLVGQATGGIGRELSKLATTVEKTATGEELPSYKIPLVGRFYGETKSSAAESGRFYKNMEKLNKHENEIKGRRESKQPLGDYLSDNPEARLAPMARKVYNDVRDLRKRREALIERDAPKESVQAVEKMITRKMQVLNDRVRVLEEGN